MNLPPLSLYIHLPWCERKCPYCDFNSHERRGFPEVQYIDALLSDLEQDLPLAQGRPIDSIFIGGGTPSLFSADSMHRLMEGVRALLPLAEAIEVTMEANPSSAEAKKFAGFRAAGINRISLGIQSFDDHCLRALGRVHDSAQALAAIDSVRTAGFDNFNLDLMHGLPGQTPAMAARDLKLAVQREPTHLSWYQLTIEPNTVFYKQQPTLPEEIALADIQDNGETILAAAGFSQYEVSAYARQGFDCRHNSNYWRFGDYLGIGAGAHGKISSTGGGIERYSKRRQPDDYIAADTAAKRAEMRRLNRGELIGEFAMNALRLKSGFSLQLFRARTGLGDADIVDIVEGLCDRGLLLREGDNVKATSTGYRFLDSVIAEFFPAV